MDRLSGVSNFSRVEHFYHSLFCIPSRFGSDFIVKKMLSYEQRLTLKGRPLLEGLYCPGGQTRIYKSCLPLKMVENLGDVPTHLTI